MMYEFNVTINVVDMYILYKATHIHTQVHQLSIIFNFVILNN